jgi:hypothetical protein
MAKLIHPRAASRWVTRLCAIALLLIGMTQPSRAQSFNEYQIKAVFLYHFAQFIDWAEQPAKPDAPFAICILGDDPFGGFLHDTVSNERIGNRPFAVRRVQSATDANGCSIVFVSKSEQKRLDPILDTLREHAVLTVSDADNFARRGGIVQFVTENKRIKLNINLDAAREAQLTISSKLLRPATIVSSERG